MSLEIITVPCLSDNYAFIARDQETGATALVDVPEAAPILAELDARGWGLDLILLTHHHDDHIQGVPEVIAKTNAKVVGAKADAHRLPKLDMALNEGDSINIGASEGVVLDVSGHTIGHIAFHFAKAKTIFTADSLMALGCGRLFEGSFAQMWESLSKMAVLDPDTLVCSGHEYTAANGRFAMSVEPENTDLQTRVKEIASANVKGVPTVPSLLSLELATNPFLRPHSPEIRVNLNMQDASDADVFAEIRRRKDNF